MAKLAFLIGPLLSCLLGSTDAVVVPGRAFDRFISIWLENQVSVNNPKDERTCLALEN